MIASARLRPAYVLHWPCNTILRRTRAYQETAINVRERFLRICNFEPAAPPHWDTLGFWNETVARWRMEGLPAGVDPGAYFGQEGAYRLPVDSGFCHIPLLPAFEHEVLADEGESIVFRDAQGIVKRDRKPEFGVSMSQFLDFPVKGRADWEALKWRLDPDTPERYPNWSELGFLDAPDLPVMAHICGAYGTPRNLFGEERLAYAYYDQPDLIHDIQRHWTDFYCRLFSRVLEHARLDYVYIWEDMAFKNGPLISPKTFAEFMLPYYKELNSHLRSLGVKMIMVDSDGDPRPLLDMFVESGVNFFMPFEIAAGMDPLPIREKYGDKLVIWGGIDKRELAKDLDAVEREVAGKVPKLMETGGFIPAVDHLVPPDVSFENYSRFIELVRQICG